MNLNEQYQLAAEALISADALLIGAGAGIGVDSGLPDFRGPEGFWKAYPPFHGRRFREISTPHWFQTDPQLAWGFFGHRLNLYRDAIPHEGFQILQRWSKRFSRGSFVFTSNVDGQFQKAGFSSDLIVECHGSIHHLQCSRPCQNDIWPVGELRLEIDLQTIKTTSPLPSCPQCGGVARPNILMFGDSYWVEDRTARQWKKWQTWLRVANAGRLVTIELGAGLAVPTVRIECELQPGTLIRVNPSEAEVEPGGISVPAGALTALREIDDRINKLVF